MWFECRCIKHNTQEYKVSSVFVYSARPLRAQQWIMEPAGSPCWWGATGCTPFFNYPHSPLSSCFKGIFILIFPLLASRFLEIYLIVISKTLFSFLFQVFLCVFLFWPYFLSSYNLSSNKLNTNHNPVINQGPQAIQLWASKALPGNHPAWFQTVLWSSGRQRERMF